MAEKLTKADLIEALHESQGLTRDDIHECVDDLFEELKRAMLEVRHRKGKAHARNPKTGEIVSVEDHGVAAFRPGRELRQQAWTIKAPSVLAS
jgi:integration host factor subunit beta